MGAPGDEHAALRRAGWARLVFGVALGVVLVVTNAPLVTRVFLYPVAVFAAVAGLGRFATISKERRAEAAQEKRVTDWMAGRIKIERSVTEQPGMRLADVEALLAEARQAGATDDAVVHAESFFRGEGIERLWIEVERKTQEPE